MAVYLEEFVESIENLPAEIKHHLSEIRSRDDQNLEVKRQIQAAQKTYLQSLKTSPQPQDGDSQLQIIKEMYTQAKALSDEKVLLTEKALDLINRHLKRLDETISVAVKDHTTTNGANYDLQELGLSATQAVGILDSPRMSRRSRPQSRPPKSSRRRRNQSSSSFDEGDSEDSENLFYEDALDSQDKQSEFDQDQVFCICQQASYGEMIACDNTGACAYEWFHLECLGLTQPPNGQWYCPMCASKLHR